MTPKTHLPHSAKIVEWNPQKGFGYLRVEKRRVFLHWKEFSTRPRRPVLGDLVRFEMGADSKGRPCAVNAQLVNKGGRVSLGAWMLLLILLPLPLLALRELEINVFWIIGYVVAINALTYSRYSIDKQRAQAKEWRVSESELHFLELLGGWPAGFLAQRRLRHKCSKVAYQVVFWMVVMLYQFLALDWLLDWSITRFLWDLLLILSAELKA